MHNLRNQLFSRKMIPRIIKKNTIYRTTGNMLFNDVYFWYALPPFIRLRARDVKKNLHLWMFILYTDYNFKKHPDSSFMTVNLWVLMLDILFNITQFYFEIKNHCFYLTIACPYLTDTYTHILYKEGFGQIGYHISTDP